ncbi:MAG: (Fe-S)-binding protein [Desulfovibrio sp.]|jgi:Fe-S oxidoreductase|nr:(Fe-S)-binding protein [Desulfovibrio sp.]
MNTRENYPRRAEQALSPLSAEAADTCARCGFCKIHCPTYPFGGGFETYSPRARLHFLRAYCQGREKLTPEWVDRLYRCTSCERCEAVCQTGIPLVRLWEDIRAESVRRGLGPMPAHKRVREMAEKFGNPYGEDPSRQTHWLTPEHTPAPEAETLLFGGCTGTYKMPGMLRTGVAVLSRLGFAFTYAGGEECCCASPLLRTGQVDAALSLIARNLDLFARRKTRLIITPCGGCSKTLKKDYPLYARRLGKPFDIQVMHFSELYVRLLREGGLKPSRPVDKTVTFHDPCHLGRSQGLFREPREILAAIPGLRLTEMPGNREASRCCGAGGGVKANYPQMAGDIARDRLREAEATGADCLVTMCPFCMGSFKQAIEESGSSIQLCGLEELLWASLE